MLISSLYLPKGREHVLRCIKMLCSSPFPFHRPPQPSITAWNHLNTPGPLLSVCVWSVCGWMGHEESLRRSTVHSAQVTRWVCLTLDWPGSRLSSPEGCLPTSLFLSFSYLFFLLFSPCFLSRGSIMGGWFSSARREQISWPGRASHPTGPLTMINHIHTLSLVSRGPPHTHTYIHIQHCNLCAHTYTHTHTQAYLANKEQLIK